MSRGKRYYREELPPAVAEDTQIPTTAEDTSPLLQDAPILTTEQALVAAIKDGWTQREDGLWSNNRAFNIPGGVVPQGVLRNTEEAYALEMRRRE